MIPSAAIRVHGWCSGSSLFPAWGWPPHRKPEKRKKPKEESKRGERVIRLRWMRPMGLVRTNDLSDLSDRSDTYTQREGRRSHQVGQPPSLFHFLFSIF